MASADHQTSSTTSGQTFGLSDKTFLACLIGGVILALVFLLFALLVIKSRRLKRRSEIVLTVQALSRFHLANEHLRAEQRRELKSSRYVKLPLKLKEGPTDLAGHDDTFRLPSQHASIDLRSIPSSMIFNGQLVTLEAEIGLGNFSRVYKGRLCRRTGDHTKDVAVKVCRDDVPHCTATLLHEARLIANLDHRNIVPLLGVSCSPAANRTAIYLEFMHNNDLQSLLSEARGSQHVSVICEDVSGCLQRKQLKVEPKVLLGFAKDISAGMCYLSSKGYVHRDLAARNCLLDSRFTVKIADFGLALSSHEQGEQDVGSDHFPLRWLAIESLTYRIFSTKTDVWAFGVVLWELFAFGEQPYLGLEDNEIRNLLSSAKRLSQPPLCPDNIYSVMCQCWNASPECRPGFDHLRCIIGRLSNIHESAQYSPAALRVIADTV